jgi:hypothetical protein
MVYRGGIEQQRREITPMLRHAQRQNQPAVVERCRELLTILRQRGGRITGLLRRLDKQNIYLEEALLGWDDIRLAVDLLMRDAVELWASWPALGRHDVEVAEVVPAAAPPPAPAPPAVVVVDLTRDMAAAPATIPRPAPWPDEPLLMDDHVKEGEACCICLSRRAVCTHVPCGHMVLCVTCASESKHTACHVCKQKVDCLIRIYQ